MSHSVPDKEALSEVWKKVKDRSIPLKPLTQAEYDVLDDTQKFADICYLVSKNAHITEPSDHENIPDNLNDCTWHQISYLSRNNLFRDYFSVGDTKTILLNGQIGNGLTANNLEIDLVVVGINHNMEIEGGPMVHFMLGAINGVPTCLDDDQYFETPGTGPYFYMNPSSTNNGGWNSSSMKVNIMPQLKNALPDDLKSVMRSVKKWTDNTGTSQNISTYVTETEEDICLPSEFEIFGVRQWANSEEQNKQAQYEWFSLNGIDARKFKRLQGAVGRFYTRSPSKYSSTSFCGVIPDGSDDWLTCSASYGVVSLLFV